MKSLSAYINEMKTSDNNLSFENGEMMKMFHIISTICNTKLSFFNYGLFIIY